MNGEKLFCFPYAGGSSTLYEGCFQGLKGVFDVIPVDYSGHGTKFGMPLNETMDALVDEAFREVAGQLSREERCCLFGYSLGSIVAYEVACRLRDEGYRAPRTLFLASMQAPHRIPESEWIHQLSDDDFLKEMVKNGGISEELASDPLLAEAFLPIIRADFQIYELYEGKKHDVLDANALILYSKEDISEADIHGWDGAIAHTEYLCYPGGHFFIYDRYGEVVEEIKKRR